MDEQEAALRESVEHKIDDHIVEQLSWYIPRTYNGIVLGLHDDGHGHSPQEIKEAIDRLVKSGRVTTYLKGNRSRYLAADPNTLPDISGLHPSQEQRVRIVQTERVAEALGVEPELIILDRYGVKLTPGQIEVLFAKLESYGYKNAIKILNSAAEEAEQDKKSSKYNITGAVFNSAAKFLESL